MDTYASAMHRYVSFITQECNRPLAEALPTGAQGLIPTELVTLFISHAATRYKLSTIKVTLAALVDWHKSKKASHASVSQSNPAIQQLLQSVATYQGPSGMPVGKTGMTKGMLFQLLKHIRSQEKAQLQMKELYVRDWAIFALGFYGLFRRSELIALTMADITLVTNPTPYIAITVRKSKTDKVGAGAVIYVSAVTRDGLRIADGIRNLLELRRASGAGPTDPLFPAWDLDARRLYKSTPLSNGQALAQRLQKYLKSLLSTHPDLAINPSSYGMHSLRRGVVVAAWKAGVDLERIKAHGRWKSDAVRAYMTPDISIKLSVSAAM